MNIKYQTRLEALQSKLDKARMDLTEAVLFVFPVGSHVSIQWGRHRRHGVVTGVQVHRTVEVMVKCGDRMTGRPWYDVKMVPS